MDESIRPRPRTREDIEAAAPASIRDVIAYVRSLDFEGCGLGRLGAEADVFMTTTENAARFDVHVRLFHFRSDGISEVVEQIFAQDRIERGMPLPRLIFDMAAFLMSNTLRAAVRVGAEKRLAWADPDAATIRTESA